MSIQWALMGALAANRYRASPRLTNDIDLLLADTGPGIEELEHALIKEGWSAHRADSQAELIRLRHQQHGVADLLIAGTNYQHQALQRKVPANNRSTYLASTSGSKFIGSKARRSSSFLASGYFSNNVCK